MFDAITRSIRKPLSNNVKSLNFSGVVEFILKAKEM